MFKVSVLDIKSASVIFAEMATSVVLPGEEGEFSILDFHQSIVSCLRQGEIKIDKGPVIPIQRGIIRMEKNKLSILVER
jgi:F0F1-type ATP synthase epsilon subunit